MPQPHRDWSNGPGWSTRPEALHEIFARVAAAFPDSLALVSNRGNQSYQELNRHAGDWARELARAGVGPGCIVPIALDRGVDLVTALLAVLKCGAAYSLLDTGWPAARLRAVTGQLSSPVVITRRDAAPFPAKARWSPPGHRPAAALASPPPTVPSTQACCVFFTSGTTGRPKGAVSPHKATARLFQCGGFAAFGPGTVMPLAAAVAWDAFSLELWAPLLHGGTSVLIDEPFLSAAALRAAIAGHGVNTVWVTSSLFNLIVDEDLEAMRGLSQVMTGGERLSVPHVRRFLAHHPEITLINGYGPVESTVFATTRRITAEDCERRGGIPLGSPVPGTSVYVLDGRRQCAIGETGDIYIAGDGLALGYLGDPRLTAEKFTEAMIDGRRLRVYRTGDLGAWHAEGFLEYHGRADRQLKIRGHRVEPAEIERQVERLLPEVSACTVVAVRDDQATARALVAFCVPVRAGDQLAGAREVLDRHLVTYQRPAQVVSVEKFPVTAQGKLDEGALLDRLRTGSASPAQRDPGAKPSGQDRPVRLVVEIFRQVLGVTAVPAQASFFDLGGDSLAAARACARLSAKLGRPVPLAWIYESPTAAALGASLRERAAPAGSALTAGPDIVPLSPMQLVFLTRHLTTPTERTGYCLMFWRIDGALDTAALERAIAVLHARHEPLRAAYRADPRPGAVVTGIAAPALEILPPRATTSAAVDALRMLFQEGLEPAEADLWRTAIVPIEEGGGWVFGLVVHHIAFDGWSEPVLARDLSDAYAGHLPPGKPPPGLAQLAARTASVHPPAEFVNRVEAVRQEIHGVPELRWPAVAASRAPGTAAPGQLRAAVTRSVLAGIEARAARLRVSSFAVLLAAWAATIASVCGQDDFAVGVPVAQRTDPVLAQTIGCYINTIALRLRGPAIQGGEQGIGAVAAALRRALAASDIPFEAVARRERSPGGRTPVFQTLFALQDNAAPRLELPGATATFLRQPYLDLPLELHAELWPDERGGLDVVISYQPRAVSGAVVAELMRRYRDALAHSAREGRGVWMGQDSDHGERQVKGMDFLGQSQ